MMQDVLLSLKFWDKPGAVNLKAWETAREDFYKKHPELKSTKLSYWLKEELDEKELAKLNAIVKKFGVKY
jgi:glycine betaine/choline ABC-type transport system substrate-binding protein